MSGQCSRCEDYRKSGHNYCRMCGFHLRKGFVRNVRMAVAYYVDEKFCGYCGGKKHECECTK